MIRFTPDSLLDAVFRIVAMALPQGNIYTEIIAPEVKPLICISVLAIGLTLRRSRVNTIKARPIKLGVVLVAMYVLWIFTSGNGRYFLVPLMLFGVLIAALARTFATSKGWALSIVLMVTLFQLYTVKLTGPQDAWVQTRWTSSQAFDIELDGKSQTQPSTYLSYSEPSFSIVAMQFSPQSRWINLAFLDSKPNSFEARRVQEIIAESNSLTLILPTPPTRLNVGSSPTAVVQSSIQSDLKTRGLEVRDTCRFLASQSLTPSYKFFFTDGAGKSVAMSAPGFWLCPLARVPRIVRAQLSPPEIAAAVFQAVENKCPRYFPNRSRAVRILDDVTIARYPEADMVLKVYANGQVTYQYYNNFQETSLGETKSVLNTALLSCNKIAGREIFPWQRIQ